jgi:hypothetical protein
MLHLLVLLGYFLLAVLRLEALEGFKGYIYESKIRRSRQAIGVGEGGY